MTPKNQTPLPYTFYYLVTLFVNLLGIATAGYLTLTHYKNYTDPAFSSFCAISKAINCDTVAQSPWSVLFGLPVSVWGLLGYLIFLVLLLNARNEKNTLRYGISCCSWVLCILRLHSISAIFQQ